MVSGPGLQSREASVMLDDIHVSLKGPAGPVNILRGVSIRIDKGEAVAVVGPSGSGKSTMMMVAAGLERITSGSARICGQDIGPLDEDALAVFRRDHVGVVFQSFHLVPTMSALENVAIPLELAGSTEAFERARDGLQAVGLGHRLHHVPAQLSGGEQQRVALARAFAVSPDLVLADEPTGNLDGATGAMIMDLLFDHRRRNGTSLMLVTHDPALAARCDRTVHLEDGRLVSHA
ncbi:MULTISPECIES: ABC transporter ATP-binding protein [unclassified Haematospirillum]|uniref:ABC transporter ATP-binding protein n=1 Tax=unclassified Haematospirillum TaxID=2622088 RepID=UPI001FD736CB|nr:MULTISPECIES: ABC transporter ATP-binding protein [unclassified Haematospirillum]